MKHMKTTLLMILAAFAVSACGEQGTSNESVSDEITPEGDVKLETGKADAWNWRNDPARFRTELNYAFDELPTEAEAGTPWSANYWPNYKDSINDRWQGVDVLSPAEKYDVAFHKWEASEEFMTLKPFNSDTCEWDEDYYKGLGPVADWTSNNKGNKKSRNGLDDDNDGIADKDECKSNVDGDKNEEQRDGVETWWGICHAWAPAAIMEPEPLASVTRDGVTFDVSDQKALLMMQWDKSSAHVIGGRCNDKEVERDPDTGRVLSAECRDLNAGAWHVIVSNIIGLNNRGMVIERTWDYEVWNQPLFGYKVTLNKEISLDRAHELLNLDTDSAGGSGEPIHGIREGSNTAIGIINLLNGASLPKLDNEVGLDKRAAEALIAFRSGDDGTLGTNDDLTFSTLQEVEDTFFVGESAFGRLAQYAKDNGFVPDRYAYNDDAVTFIEIKMTSNWITEQHPLKGRTDTDIQQYTRHDRYHYILELDADRKVLGGEWVGSSIAAHPDFVWLPVRGFGGNPHLDIDVIRDIVNEGRLAVLGQAAEGRILDVSNFDVVTIPDNDPAGVSSTITVTEEGKIQSLTIDLDISHTYRGDLTITLQHGNITIPVYDGRDADNRSADNVVLTAEIIKGFESFDAKGEWKLVVTDTANIDKGALNTWSLHFELTD